MGSIADLFAVARVVIDEKSFDLQAVAAADRTGKNAGDAMNKQLKNKMTAGGAALGATLGAGIAGASTAWGTFEDRLRTVNTVLGVSDDQLTAIGEDVLALSRETGKGTDDLTQGLYDLVSAGVPAEKAISVLRDSAHLAVGSLGTTGEAVDLVTSALNAYDMEADQSAKVTDIFAQAVKDGKVTAGQLGQTLANIAPIAASAGVSLEEVSAGYALLTAKGVPAAQAATQMRAAISALLTPNATLNQLTKETGINWANMAKEKGLAVTLEELRKATHGNQEAFAKALGSVEALNYALVVTGDNAPAAAAELDKMYNSTGQAAEQYDEKSKSAVEQAKRWTAVIQTGTIEVGKYFGALSPLLLTLNQLGPAFGTVQLGAKGFGAILGGLVGKMFGKQLADELIGTIPTTTVAASSVGAAAGTAQADAQAAVVAASGPEQAAAVAATGPEVTAAATAVGAEAGKAQGVAMAGSKGGRGLLGAFGSVLLGPAGLTAIAAVAVAATWMYLDDELNKKAAEVQEKASTWATTATADELEHAKAEIAKQRDQGLLTVPLNVVYGLDKKIDATLDEITKEQTRREIAGMDLPALKASLDARKKLFEKNKSDVTWIRSQEGKDTIAAMNLTYDRIKFLDNEGLNIDGLKSALAARTAEWEAHSNDVAWYASPEGLRLKKSMEEAQALLAQQQAAMPNPLGQLPDKAADSMDEILEATRKANAELINEERTARQQLNDVWTAALDESQRAADIAGELIITQSEMRDRQLLADLKSRDAAVRAAAEKKLRDLQTDYAKLLVEDTRYGTEAERIAKLTALLQSKAMREGLDSDNPYISALWSDVEAETKRQLASLQTDVGEYADVIAMLFPDALKNPSTITAIQEGAAYQLATYASGLKLPNSPSSSSGSAPSSGGSHGSYYDSITGKVVSYDVGTPRVPYDRIALVHKDEAVLTTDEADDWRAGMGKAGPGPEIIQLVVSGRVLAEVMAHQSRLGR
jgi:TP901 family phage tail tape measure protein